MKIFFLIAFCIIALGPMTVPSVPYAAAPPDETDGLNVRLRKKGGEFLNPRFSELKVTGEDFLLAEKGKETIRIKIMAGLDRLESDKHIAGQASLLEEIFEPHLPPYPEFLTNQTACDKSFRPVRKGTPLGPYFLLYSGERLSYGLCAKKLIKYKAGLAYFYCQDSRTLFRIEYFVPNDEGFEKIEKLLRDFQCIKPGGR